MKNYKLIYEKIVQEIKDKNPEISDELARKRAWIEHTSLNIDGKTNAS